MNAPTPNEFGRESLPVGVRRFRPEWGVVLGSGLGAFVEAMEVEAEVPYAEIPGMPIPKVPGHAGTLAFGRIAGRDVVAAQGRVHLYEGRSALEVTAGVRLMAAMGIERLLLTNAAGSLNPEFEPGGWLLVADHLNLTGASPLTGGPNFHDMSEVYSAALRARFVAAAEECGIGLRQGTYAAVRGPQYETPAEVRMLRTLGADAVGMSTVLEAIQAVALGLDVAALSCLANWGAGMSAAALAHGEVLEMGRIAGPALARLFAAALG